MDVISMGEMLIDFIPGEEKNSYIRNPGGAPANVAISVKRNGLDSGFLGKLGKDDFGLLLRNTLEDEGVQVLCPELTKNAITTLAFVTLYEDGERSFTFARKPGADMLITKQDIKKDYINLCTIFHAGSFSLSEKPSKDAVNYAMKMAFECGKLISFDINYRDNIWENIEFAKKEVEQILPYVHFLKISEEELFFVSGEDNIFDLMEEYNIAVIILTLGEKGAKYFYRNNSTFIEGEKVKAIDATGAGDAFWGGFLSKILLHKVTTVNDLTEEIIKDAVHYGNASGALCVQKKGGIPALPRKEEVERFLK